MLHEDLIEQKERVSRKRIIRLMREDGLEARAPASDSEARR